MIVRKIAARGRPRTGPESRPPRRNRAWVFLFLTLGAGGVSGIVALIGPAVVTDVGAAITTHVAATTDQPVQASTLFPAGSSSAQGDRRLRSAASEPSGPAAGGRAPTQPQPIAAQESEAYAFRLSKAYAFRLSAADAAPKRLRLR